MPLNFGRSLASSPDRETARPWPDIEAMFSSLARDNPVFEPLAELTRDLAQSVYVDAGLCGATSMFDLVVGPSTYVFQNPHLRIEYDFDANLFRLIYVDGSPSPWKCSARRDEVTDTINLFLTKWARWYHRR